MPDPEKIGKYQILERIGRGGMGYVYRAHDPVLKRDVAIKTMLKGLSEDEELRTRFLREAQSAGGLRHPNIVTIYDLGEDDQNVPYIAMEFLTGTDLENIVKNRVELSLLKKLDCVIQTCNGLGYAHSNGIVHRDIKAANIRLLDNGEVKIMDFGIAKMSSSHMTRTGMIMGTPHYMAPEQIRGEKVDGRADIFSLGVVLYEILVFRKPYPGENPTTVLFKIIHEDPEPLVDATFTPPEGLEEVVSKALGKKTSDRYQSCEEFAEDLIHVYSLLQQTQPRGEAVKTDPNQGPSGTMRISETPRMQRKIPAGIRSGTPLPSKARLAVETPPPQSSTGVDQKTAIAPNLPSDAGPTVLSPQTQATITDSSQAATELNPAVVPEPQVFQEAPVGAPKKWLVPGIAAALILAGLISWIVFKIATRPEVSPVPNVIKTEPVTPKPLPPPPVTTVPKNGWLALNVQPWAQISSVKDEKGNNVAIPVSITPCKIPLKPGKYEIALTNSQFKPMVLKVEIQPDQIMLINKTMEGFDYAKAVDSLGL